MMLLADPRPALTKTPASSINRLLTTRGPLQTTNGTESMLSKIGGERNKAGSNDSKLGKGNRLISNRIRTTINSSSNRRERNIRRKLEKNTRSNRGELKSKLSAGQLRDVASKSNMSRCAERKLSGDGGSDRSVRLGKKLLEPATSSSEKRDYARKEKSISRRCESELSANNRLQRKKWKRPDSKCKICCSHTGSQLW